MKKAGIGNQTENQPGNLGMVNDLIEQNESLKNQLLLLQKAIDVTGQTSWFWDTQTGEIKIEQAFQLFSEFSNTNNSFNFKWFLSIINPSDQEDFFMRIKKFMHRELPTIEKEFRIKTSKGIEKWILLKGAALELDTKGNPIKVGGMLLDISKNKSLENELKDQINQANMLNTAYNLQNLKLERNFHLLNETHQKIKDSETRFARLANNLDEGIAIIEENEIVFVNASLCQITAYSAEELKKMDGIDLAIPEEKPRILKLISELSANPDLKKQFHEIEFWIKRKNGEKRFIRNILTPNINENGEIIGRYIFTSDFTKLKKAELELKQSEEKFKMIFNHSPLGIFQFSPKGIMENINLEGCKILGSSPEKLLGFDLIHNSKNNELQTGVKKLLQYNENTFLEGSYTSVTGNRTAYLKAFFSPLNTPEGISLGGICLFEDCSQSKKFESDLLETREKLRSTLDSLDDLVIVLDKENRFSEYFVPEWFLKKYRIPSEFTGLNIEDLPLENSFAEQINNSIETLKKTKLTQHLQLPVSFAGLKFWISIKLSIRFDNQNNFNGITIVIRDITELKASEIKLAESEKQLRILINHSPDLICLKNGNGQCIEVNQAFIQLFNIPQFYKGKRTSEIFQNQPEMLHALLELEKNESEIWEHRVPNRLDYILNLPGKPRAVFDFIKIPVFDNNGNRLYIITIGRDITEKQKLTSDLIKAKEKAEESNRLKSSFLANMSHEVRTPMNGIIGFAELLKNEGLETEEKNQFIDIINRRAADLLHIIDDIIDISKIESDQLVLHPRECRLEPLFTKLLENYKDELNVRQIFQIQLVLHKSGVEQFLTTDISRLNQTVSYLLNNAIKFTPEGFIEFGQIATNDSIVIFVKDTGQGIAKNKFKLIFERFRQVEDNPTRRFGGLGLGLSIAKRLVELMHGKIWVESELGIGSTFYLQIPVKPLKTDIKNTILNNSTPGILKASVIYLHLDKNINIRELTQNLDRSNYTLCVQNSIEQVIEYLQKNKVGLILLGFQENQETTLKEIEKIKLIDSNIPIILVASIEKFQQFEDFNHFSINDYLLLPFHTSELLFRIQSLNC